LAVFVRSLSLRHGLLARTISPMNRSRKRRVVIVAFDGFQPLDVVGPFDAFHGATQALASSSSSSSAKGYEVIVAAPKRGLVRGENGLTIVADTSIASLCRAGASSAGDVDTVVVSGGAGTRRAADDPKLVAQVKALAAKARRVTSVCTGSFLLGAAGLLDGKRATTHWAFCDSLARRFPKASVEPDPIFVKAGRLWTAAGVTAGIDLTLALIEEDYGRDVALTVARWLVVFVRRAGGQSQFSAALSAQTAERDALRDVQSYIVDHPGADLAVPALARRAAMSVRNFSRAFHGETGVTPGEYVTRVRIDVARRMLEDTRRAVDDVAARAGFGTPEALRRAFAAVVGISPREYRARFAKSAEPRARASVRSSTATRPSAA
jgi:transcriptional regulator GlxA family with amidase domain